MNPPNRSASSQDWPELPLEAWQATYHTLHMWTQIIGKVRLAFTPPVNHWWNVTLHVSSCGLTTQPIPYSEGVFEIEFDFTAHRLVITTGNNGVKTLPLVPCSVAEFYEKVMAELHALGIPVKIWPVPVEVPDPIRFDKDTVHASYDPEFANRFWRVLANVDCVFYEFRSRFLGKSSPPHFFWGSFDHAVTRFSGRRAPERPGADRITREAYSHEVISSGFWPGGGGIQGAAFYTYAAPEPSGFADFPIHPKDAFYDRQLGEFILLYDAVRAASDPRSTLLDFLQSSYEAGATLGHWNRKELER